MGSVLCIPDDAPPAAAGSDPNAPQPSGEWIKTWGAISRASDGSIGATSDKLSKQDAEKEALNQCNKGGGANCKIAFTYKNQCVSLANSEGETNIGGLATGGSLEEAENRALLKCEADSKGSCEIVYTKCSLPVFRAFKN